MFYDIVCCQCLLTLVIETLLHCARPALISGPVAQHNTIRFNKSTALAADDGSLQLQMVLPLLNMSNW